MTLQQGDIAGATATGKASKPGAGYTVGYTRDLATSRPRVGTAARGSCTSTPPSPWLRRAPSVVQDIAQIRTALRTKISRDVIVASIAKSFGLAANAQAISNVVVRTPRIGDEAVELDASMRVKKMKISLALVFFGVDRVRATLSTVGLRPAVSAEVARLARLVVGHIGSGWRRPPTSLRRSPAPPCRARRSPRSPGRGATRRR